MRTAAKAARTASWLGSPLTEHVAWNVRTRSDERRQPPPHKGMLGAGTSAGPGAVIRVAGAVRGIPGYVAGLVFGARRDTAASGPVRHPVGAISEKRAWYPG